MDSGSNVDDVVCLRVGHEILEYTHLYYFTHLQIVCCLAANLGPPTFQSRQQCPEVTENGM